LPRSFKEETEIADLLVNRLDQLAIEVRVCFLPMAFGIVRLENRISPETNGYAVGFATQDG
jgi:hypothetical protein